MIRLVSIALAFVALTFVLRPFQLNGVAFDLDRKPIARDAEQSVRRMTAAALRAARAMAPPLEQPQPLPEPA